MPELLMTYLLHEIGQKLLVLCQNQVPCFHRGDFWREQKFQVVSVHQPRHSESTEVAKITNFWPLSRIRKTFICSIEQIHELFQWFACLEVAFSDLYILRTCNTKTALE